VICYAKAKSDLSKIPTNSYHNFLSHLPERVIVFEMLLLPSLDLLVRTLQHIWLQAHSWWSEDLPEGIQVVLHLEITIQDGSTWHFGSRDVIIDSMGNNISISMKKIFIPNVHLPWQVGALPPMLSVLNGTVVQFSRVFVGDKINRREQSGLRDVPLLHGKLVVTTFDGVATEVVITLAALDVVQLRGVVEADLGASHLWILILVSLELSVGADIVRLVADLTR